MKFILITADPAQAAIAQRCGVNRIMVDLERQGKQERQRGRDTWISQHRMDDVPIIAQVMTEADLMVRIDPLHDGSRDEIDRAIAGGANLIMLPMFRTLDEIAAAGDMIGGRAAFVPLVETAQALQICAEVARLPAVSEVFIGLNDLHLSLDMTFMFEPLANGLLEQVCQDLRELGKPFGFGGIARAGQGDLPAELIMREHVRLGSSRVILSRNFMRHAPRNPQTPWPEAGPWLSEEIGKLHGIHDMAASLDHAELVANHAAVVRRVGTIVERSKA